MSRLISPDFFGRGLSFPLRINENTGGFMMSSGNLDATSIALEYIQDSWTVRQSVTPTMNHVAEAVANILLTIPGEHDTLPEYGSRLFQILFEPNTFEFMSQATVYFLAATKRWEDRVTINEDSIRWKNPTKIGTLTDVGSAPMRLYLSFLEAQKASNLVAPYVSERQARLKEYQSSYLDLVGHDSCSRYREFLRYQYNTEIFSRHRVCNYVSPSNEDSFYRVRSGDTWLRISYSLYADIRYWWVLADCYIKDASLVKTRSEVFDYLEPVVGDIIRVPSKTRLLTELV